MPKRKARKPSQLDPAAARAKAEAVLNKLREKRGMLTHIANELGIKPQAVHQWKVVPLDRLHDVARLTHKSPRRLRPDFYLPARSPSGRNHNTRSRQRSSFT